FTSATFAIGRIDCTTGILRTSLLEFIHKLDKTRFQRLQTGVGLPIDQPQPVSGSTGGGRFVVLVELTQVEEFLVIAKVGVAQLGEAVEPEALDHQSLEMVGQKIGEIEGAGLAFALFDEGIAAVKFVAVRS